MVTRIGLTRSFFFMVSGSTPDEFLSSTSIFDHVDRLSRGSSDGMRRQGNKVQLIAMQPQPSPPHAASQPSPSLTEKVRTEDMMESLLLCRLIDCILLPL